MSPPSLDHYNLFVYAFLPVIVIVFSSFFVMYDTVQKKEIKKLNGELCGIKKCTGEVIEV